MDGLRKRCSSTPIAAASLVVSMLAMAAAPARAAGPGGGWPRALEAGPSPLLAIGAPRSTGDMAPAAVVALESDAPEQGAALTLALRRAFASRGLSGGEEVTLSELRLALGCKDASPDCLAQGGAVVRARRIIYGSLRRVSGGWSVEVTMVEADGGTAITEERTLTDADLAIDGIDVTAYAIVDRLAPDTVASPTPEQGTGGLATPPPPPPPPPEPVDRADDEDEGEAGDGRLRWGWVRPQPRWKWIGFGVGVGVAAAGFAPAIGMSVWLRSPDRGFRKELLDAAEASLSDESMINDIDPSLPEGVNLCDFARERPTDENGTPLGMEGQVRNSDVVLVCNKGDSIRKGSVIASIVGGVGLATAVAFTILLFVHREPVRRASAWRRHGMMVGVEPVPGEGVSLRLGGRF